MSATEQDFEDAEPFVDPWWDIASLTVGENSHLLMESGDLLLLESGDRIIL